MKEFEDFLKNTLEGNKEGGLGNIEDLGKLFEGSDKINPLDILETLKTSELGNIVEGNNPLGGIFEGIFGSIINDCGEKECRGSFFDDLENACEFNCEVNVFGSANVVENEKSYVVTVGLPGASKADIKVSAEEDNLIVSVNIEDGVEEKEETVIFTEYSKKSVERDFYLPKADFSKLKANFKNGELKVEVPKIEVETVFFDIK